MEGHMKGHMKGHMEERMEGHIYGHMNGHMEGKEDRRETRTMGKTTVSSTNTTANMYKITLGEPCAAYSYQDWQCRESGSIVPFAVAAANLPQEPGLASGSSAVAVATTSDEEEERVPKQQSNPQLQNVFSNKVLPRVCIFQHWVAFHEKWQPLYHLWSHMLVQHE